MMIRKTGQLLAILFAFITTASAQQHDVNVKVSGLGNDTVYLANYYGAKLFYNDTTVAVNGEFTLKARNTMSVESTQL